MTWRSVSRKKRRSHAPKEPKDLEIAEVIKTEELKKGTLTRAQTKFAKYLRELMDDHKHVLSGRTL